MQPTVIVLGASADRSKFGNKAVRAFAHRGWRVIPVNPRGGEIEGLPVVTNLTEVPQAANVTPPVDAITVYLPPGRSIPLLPAMAALQPKTIWFNPGAESRELLDAAAKLGLPVTAACSIVAIGLSPSQFPD